MFCSLSLFAELFHILSDFKKYIFALYIGNPFNRISYSCTYASITKLDNGFIAVSLMRKKSSKYIHTLQSTNVNCSF